MKKIILSLIFVGAFFATAFTQSFSVSTDTFEGTYHVDKYPSNYIYVENTSNESLNLNFEVLTNSLALNGWDVTLCTHKYCYSRIPNKTSFGTFKKGEKGFFNIHVGFNNNPFTGEISFRIYDPNDESNADTIYFIYHATTTSSIADVSGLHLVSYPNPVIDQINIEGFDNSFDHTASIITIEGAEVLSQDLGISRRTIDVKSLKKGIYFLMVREEDQIVYSSKFVKL